MPKSRAVDIQRLKSDVEWALQQGLGPRDLVPMLERLRKHAPRGSDAARFAGTELAEVLLLTNPWRSAVLAREVLAHEDTDRAWAVLGLAHILLGNYRCAKRAFAKALVLAPGCTSYAHNLGHLLDAGLGRSREAIPWLARAYHAHPDDADVASSYARALVRVGRERDARSVLERALGPSSATVGQLLERWAVDPRMREPNALD